MGIRKSRRGLVLCVVSRSRESGWRTLAVVRRPEDGTEYKGPYGSIHSDESFSPDFSEGGSGSCLYLGMDMDGIDDDGNSALLVIGDDDWEQFCNLVLHYNRKYSNNSDIKIEDVIWNYHMGDRKIKPRRKRCR